MLAQGRRAERHHVEPEVEVLAEAPRLDLLAELLVGRRDDAHVDLDHPLAADAAELAGLQRPQHLGLGGQAHVADLVEEEGAAVGDLEQAALAADRAGEGALLVAEELALDELGRDGRAVHLDELAARRAGCCRGWRGR